MQRYRLIKRLIFPLIALMVMFLITLTHAAAQDSPFYWDFININMEVQNNGDMLVTETQKYVFNTAYQNQRYRYISLNKVDGIVDITVQENGHIIPSETGIENNQMWIRWEHELNPPEAHTFVLRYRVVGGLHIDPQNTQVYWKAIFADRKAPVKKAAIKVQLPESVLGKVLSFTNFGVPANAGKINDRTFEFVANQPIQPGQELEVQIVFPTDIINVPKPHWQQVNSSNFAGNPVIFYFNNWLFTFPATVLAVACVKSLIACRCPECKTFKLKRTRRVLIPPTSVYAGRQRVTCVCQNCSYYTEYDETIPHLSESGGGGGGDSGGGGDGGGGGGGDGGGDGGGG